MVYYHCSTNDERRYQTMRDPLLRIYDEYASSPESARPFQDEYRRRRYEADAARAAIERLLDSEQKSLFIEYTEASNRLGGIEEQQDYVSGFAAGIRTLLSALLV